MLDSRVINILLEKNLISKDDLAKGYEAAGQKGGDLESFFIARGISEKEILNAKSQAFGVSLRSLEGEKIPLNVLKYVPEGTAQHYKFVPLAVKDGVLEVGMVDPDSIEAREALQFITSKSNLPFKIFLISQSDFNKVLQSYKGLGSEVTRVLGELESALEMPEELPKDLTRAEGAISEEAPITKMVAVILRHAIEGSATDIHIEPLADKLRVRFRVDGILYTSLLLPLRVHEAIISRVKILTNMQIDEKRKPQDGRFSARIENRDIDFRVSTLPTFFGEKVAIRILDPQKNVQTLADLGLEERDLDRVEKILKKPYGLILLTGPTGSGKTTTLYAMLQNLDRERTNIVSLEDPIEYNIEGINQSQVRPEIDYDFASGLRSILRQDPDIMMVGEIRDKETAQLAVHAALTGHLVFSTLHTNTALGVVPRLIDMGVDPYLIAPTLVMVVGQRLVRTLCEDSRKALAVKDSLKELLERKMSDIPPAVKKSIKIPDKIYQALPSSKCPKGTRGRTGIFEILFVNQEIERLILARASEEEILNAARQEGMLTMEEDGLLKVFKGKVGLEELGEVI